MNIQLKKALAAMLAATLSAGMLTGCGSQSGSSASAGSNASDGSSEAFTLRISTTGETDDGLDVAMATFKEKYPNVEFEIITSPWSETRDKQLMMLSMDDYPDIGKMADWHKEFYDDGLLVNLKPEIEGWDIYDNLVPGQLERMEDGGDVISAITFNNNTTLVLCNKDLLDQLGVDAPETFDDLAEIGRLVKETGIKSADGQNVYAASVPTGIWAAGSWIFSNGGSFMNEDNTVCTVDDDATVAAHQLMQDFVKNGWAPVPDGTADQMWLNGQIVCHFSGEWKLTESKDAGINTEVIKVPAGSTGKGISSIGGVEWGVFEGSENKDKAIEFLEILYSHDFQMKVDRGVTDLAIYDDPEKQAAWEESGVLDAKMKQKEQLSDTRFNYMENCVDYPEGSKIYKAALERILINMEDPKTVLTEAAAQINEGLAR